MINDHHKILTDTKLFENYIVVVKSQSKRISGMILEPLRPNFEVCEANLAFGCDLYDKISKKIITFNKYFCQICFKEKKLKL